MVQSFARLCVNATEGPWSVSWKVETFIQQIINPNSFCQAAHYKKFVYLLLLLNASTAPRATLDRLEIQPHFFLLAAHYTKY